MSHRTFISPDGARWQVWDMPGQNPDALPGGGGSLRQVIRDGWLCFESDGHEKRRLTPIPARWEERSEADLWLYCRVAEPTSASHCSVVERGSTSEFPGRAATVG